MDPRRRIDARHQVIEDRANATDPFDMIVKGVWLASVIATVIISLRYS